MSVRARSFTFCLIALGIMGLVSGCSHPFIINNVSQYTPRPEPSLRTEKTVGMVGTAKNEAEQIVVDRVADNLRKYVKEVVYPYRAGKDVTPDVVANVTLSSDYSGSAANFFLDWPGFLIWAPVWNGYVYGVKYDFDVKLDRGSDNTSLKAFKTTADLDIRHSSMSRTWLPEVGGWLLPGYSAVAFIGGFFHIQYNSDITPMAAKESANPVGDYVAQEMARAIQADTAPPPANGGGAAAAPSQEKLGAALRELKKLKDDGAITADEYDAKRKEILNKY